MEAAIDVSKDRRRENPDKRAVKSAMEGSKGAYRLIEVEIENHTLD